jgi:DNA polymerase
MQITLGSEIDFAGFREKARSLLSAGVAPEQVQWVTGSGTDLFEGDACDLPVATGAKALTLPAQFLRTCETASLNADPQRFTLLYRVLWRMQRDPSLRGDPLDPDVMAVHRMAKEVGHEMHKMRAFVRFRQVPHPQLANETLHAAWFEPTHHIVEANAPWFMRRFAQMHWAILTPEACAAWDREELRILPGARREDAPAADAGEQLWLTYYASIFNPARLKLAMMEKEMPRRFWRNLPEARLISPLAATAVQRAGGMIDSGATQPRRRIRAAAPAGRVVPIGVGSLDALRTSVGNCSACPLAAAATQAVHGEGPTQPHLMFVGEQPGDHEDLEGRPFAGPAGELLSRAFAESGIERGNVYLTNAVKHFKYELRGRRRIHKTPAQQEAQACSAWLEHEISLVGPRAIVALGATAARSLLQRPVAVLSERGRWHQRADGLQVFVTVHPSHILRLPPHEQDAAFASFAGELRTAAAHRW